ncbi:hypothetical protein Bca101_019022 [Brassica carinata]
MANKTVNLIFFLRMKAIMISSQALQGTALSHTDTLHHFALSFAIGLQCSRPIESIIMSVTRRKIGNQVEITELSMANKTVNLIFFLRMKAIVISSQARQRFCNSEKWKTQKSV